MKVNRRLLCILLLLLLRFSGLILTSFEYDWKNDKLNKIQTFHFFAHFCVDLFWFDYIYIDESVKQRHILHIVELSGPAEQGK